MTDIKKQYLELYTILEANKNKKVSSILPELLEIMTKSVLAVSSAVRYTEDGEVEAIFCYYHKEWELVSEVEYGKKASSKTGLATMCKIGVNQWSKQQRAKKKAQAELLDSVADGEILAEEVPAKLAEIAEAAKEILPR